MQQLHSMRMSQLMGRHPTAHPSCRWRRLLGPAGPELTCEECFDQLDRYVELELADADQLIVGIPAHLDGCQACNEEHQSLLALIRSER